LSAAAPNYYLATLPNDNPFYNTQLLHPGQLSLAIPPQVGKMSTGDVTAIAREETASSA